MPVSKRYIAIYFCLTIPLAWIFWIPLILIKQGQWTLAFQLPDFVLSSLGALSPLIAILIIQKISRGKVTLKGIFRKARLREWKAGWVLSSIFIFPGLHLLNTGTYYLVEMSAGNRIEHFPIFDPEVFTNLGWGIIAIIPVHFITSLVTSPIFEEPGWRGFAFENLQAYLPRDVASLITGSYWWLWHQGMNIAFDLQPSVYRYVSMLAHSFTIDALYTLSGGNLLAAIFAHGIMSTLNTLFFDIPEVWYLMVSPIIAVGLLRYLVYRKSQINREAFVFGMR